MFVKVSTHLESAKNKCSTTFKALKIFPTNRLTNNTNMQHLGNPHAICQAIDIKKALIGKQPNFITLNFPLHSFRIFFSFKFGVQK